MSSSRGTSVQALVVVGYFFQLTRALVRNRNPWSVRGETWLTSSASWSHITVVFLFKIPNFWVFSRGSLHFIYYIISCVVVVSLLPCELDYSTANLPGVLGRKLIRNRTFSGNTQLRNCWIFHIVCRGLNCFSRKVSLRACFYVSGAFMECLFSEHWNRQE